MPGDDDREARFIVHALYGPPRPVVVISVHGEIDQRNEGEFVDRLHEAVALAGSDAGTPHFGTRRTADAVVVDLRATGFLSVSAANRLRELRPVVDGELRVVVDPTSTVARYLTLQMTTGEIDPFTDIADAVLADVTVED